ncbi:MAG: 16S rRNA (cytosine(1402)-N(4))-methyltransferase RsmH [Prevotella sp.]|nr:16S rRNA (cytosine(1402)-N(4))-methyltransferase RsmH [Prevotella sp.]
MIQTSYHTPVLLQESIEGLSVKSGGVYVDVTFGGGGHSREILLRLKQTGHLYSFDQDADVKQNIGKEEPWCNNFTFIHSNFRYLQNWMRYYRIAKIDGLIADLGVSSHHFDDKKRGFSFRYDTPLDMRMNSLSDKTAANIVNEYDEELLANIFSLYGELKNARHIAAAIVKSRKQSPIYTTADLIRVVESLFKREREKKEMAKLFQALRIEVNHEMEALKEMIKSTINILKPGGRLSVITYHSLEDRIVKNIIRTGNIAGIQEHDFYGRIKTPFMPIGKVITPNSEEQSLNPRSRSAKLRIAERRKDEKEQ